MHIWLIGYQDGNYTCVKAHYAYERFGRCKQDNNNFLHHVQFDYVFWNSKHPWSTFHRTCTKTEGMTLKLVLLWNLCLDLICSCTCCSLDIILRHVRHRNGMITFKYFEESCSRRVLIIGDRFLIIIARVTRKDLKVLIRKTCCLRRAP